MNERLHQLTRWHSSLYLLVGEMFYFFGPLSEEERQIDNLMKGPLARIIGGDFDNFIYRYLQEYVKHGVMEITPTEVKLTEDGKALYAELKRKQAKNNIESEQV